MHEGSEYNNCVLLFTIILLSAIRMSTHDREIEEFMTHLKRNFCLPIEFLFRFCRVAYKQIHLKLISSNTIHFTVSIERMVRLIEQKILKSFHDRVCYRNSNEVF